MLNPPIDDPSGMSREFAPNSSESSEPIQYRPQFCTGRDSFCYSHMCGVAANGIPTDYPNRISDKEGMFEMLKHWRVAAAVLAAFVLGQLNPTGFVYWKLAEWHLPEIRAE